MVRPIRIASRTRSTRSNRPGRSTRDPEIAIQLATMYDRANRNDDALVVLREAFRKASAGMPCCAITRR